MNRLQRIGLLKAVFCCLLLLGLSFIQVAPAALADGRTIFNVQDSQGDTTISLDGIKANINAGNYGHVGDLVLLDVDGKNSAHVGGTGDIELGANGHDAKVELSDAAGKQTVSLDAATANIYAGNDGHVGDLILLDYDGKNSAHVGGTGDIELGANGHDAKVELSDAAGKQTVSLDAAKANIYAGNGGHVGDLILLDDNGKNSAHVGGTGDIELGANGHDAKVELSDAAGKQTVSLDAAKANIYAGNDGHVGDLILLDDNGKNSAHVGGTGDIELGANGHDAKVELSDAAGQITIKLDAKTGDIVFSGTSLKSLLERIVALENKK